MKRFSIRTLLIGCVVLALLIGYFREPLVRWVRTHELPYELVESEEELQEMLAERNAFLFVQADWSLDSVIAKQKVDEFVTNWSWFSRKPTVKFYIVDITGLEHQDMLIRWAKSDQKLQTIYHGYGSAVWLREGEVLQVLDGSYLASRDDLAKETRDLFQE